MKLFHINLREPAGLARRSEPVTIGVPFAEGVIASPELLHLRNQHGEHIASDKTVTAVWPDGSVRWCLLRFSAALSANSYEAISVNKEESPPETTKSARIHIAELTTSLTIHNDTLTLSADKADARWLIRATIADADNHFEINAPILETANGFTCTPRIDHIEISPESSHNHAGIKQRGRFITEAGDTFCRFESYAELFADSNRLKLRFCVHNPRAAEHGGGLWDLGDPGSVFFKQLALPVKLPEAAHTWYQLEAEQEWTTSSANTSLLQASSGGENWNSRNHINNLGELNLQFPGYRFDSDKMTQQGRRASPIVFNEAGCSVYIDQFWQQFPKAISSTDNILSLQLFPKQNNNLFELQGGEKKTHDLYINFDADHDALAWARAPIQWSIPPEYIASTACIPYFTGKHEEIEKILDSGLNGESSFFEKREKIDEYGWRNFGDVFADHESLYLPPNEVFISHYNNQYDTLYGLIRQYLHTGKPEWWELAEDLAGHIADIDIYNTEADRAEYNGGLFWHTDHYVDACTSSHRTYSCRQKPGDQTVGGGPGPEHCYSIGLMLHYFLTGSGESKSAVLSLTRWMTNVYEGSGTIIEQLVRIRAEILPKIRNAKTGKKVLNHSLPLTRGVGNYINTVLDSFTLTGDKLYLNQVDSIIRRTVHPLDDFADRNFDDVELSWHYTVFLQSVIRYLETKILYRETSDNNFRYAMDSVLHYASWMKQNEAPYLEQPDRLEFPNDTWAAQDIRKAHILYFASRYAQSAADRTEFRNQADYFYQYVFTHLSRSPTKHFTRILGILMQNHGPRSYYLNAITSDANIHPVNRQRGEYKEAPYVSRMGLIIQAVQLLGKSLLLFSPKKELHWLQYRSDLFLKIYRKLYG